MEECDLYRKSNFLNKPYKKCAEMAIFFSFGGFGPPIY